MPAHPDELVYSAVAGDRTAYVALQVDGSAWSRWSSYGDRAVDYVRECCRVLADTGLGPDEGHRVCAAGCNDGLELEEFRRQGYEAEGFDLDPEKVRVAVACGCKAKVGDMHEPPYSEGVYDCVFASHVLEHARDTGKACAALGALLKPGGVLFIVVPLEESFPLHNPSHTGFISDPTAILCHFNGWAYLEPRVLNNPEPQAVLVVRKLEATNVPDRSGQSTAAPAGE